MTLSPSDKKALHQVATRLNEAETALRDVRRTLFELYQEADSSETSSATSLDAATTAPIAPAVTTAPDALTQPTSLTPELANTQQPSVAPNDAASQPNTPGRWPYDVPAAVGSVSTDVPAKHRESLWDQETKVMRAIAVGGVIIILGGVALLIALAIQTGLLGPLGRVLLAWLVAMSLLAGAVVAKRRQLAPEGRYAMATASLLTASLTVMTTVSALEWWKPLTGAIVLLALLAAFSALARWWEDQKLLNLVNVSGFVLFIVNFLIGDFFVFPLIAPALFMAVGSMNKRWFSSRNIASYFGPLAVPATLVDVFGNDTGYPISLTVIIGVSIFTAITLVDEWDHSSDIALGFWSPLAMLTIGALMSESFFELSILCAVILGFTALCVQFRGQLATWPLSAAPFVYLLWWSKAPALGTGYLIERPMLVAVYFVLGCLFVWWLARNNRYDWYPWIAVFAVGVAITMELAKAVMLLQPAWLTMPIALIQALALAAFLVMNYLMRRALMQLTVLARVLIGLVCLHLSTLVIVTCFTFLFGSIGRELVYLGFLIGHASVSVCWMLIAAYILIVAKSLSQQASLSIGVVLALAAVVKLVFFDLSALSGFPQVSAFLISGTALLVIATLRSKRTEAERGQLQETMPAGQNTSVQAAAGPSTTQAGQPTPATESSAE